MRKIIIFSLFSAFLFSYQLSLAESYPTTCPTEAQAIIKAVGGCSAIDRVVYSNIYDKCCVTVAAPVKTTTTAPKPAVVSPTSSSVSAPESASSVIEAGVTPVQHGSDLATSTTPAEIETSTQKTEPLVILIEFVKSTFAAIFRLIGFGK